MDTDVKNEIYHFFCTNKLLLYMSEYEGGLC